VDKLRKWEAEGLKGQVVPDRVLALYLDKLKSGRFHYVTRRKNKVQGPGVIGGARPEFAFEKSTGNVRAAVEPNLKIKQERKKSRRCRRGQRLREEGGARYQQTSIEEDITRYDRPKNSIARRSRGEKR